MRSIFVDVSKYQGIDGAPIAQLVANGATAIICKASQDHWLDPAFPENAAAVVRARVNSGYYHYLVHGDPEGQADVFWAAVKGVLRPLDALVCDVERVPDPENDPHPRADDPTAIDAFRFGRRLRKLAGPHRTIVLYTSFGYWRILGNPDATDMFDDLWLAFYTLHHQALATADVSTVSFKARGLAGFRRAVAVQFGPLVLNGRAYDGDVFDGSPAQWRQKLGDGRTPQPPITERPRYRQGYAAYGAALKAAAAALKVPDPGQGPAWEAGVEAAREDSIDGLGDVVLGAPPA